MAVEKHAKKITGSANQAEKVVGDAFTARVDATIKRRHSNSEVAAAAVAKK